jgi:hopanoid biosynthesis associated protein HpnK
MASNKKLIINADDFGIHESVNNGILKGHISGCITSTTIMAGAQGFEHAVKTANSAPGLGVGVHLTFVGEKPVGDLREVASILDDTEYLHKNYTDFIKKYVQGKIDLKHVSYETFAQIEKITKSGLKLPLTHLDSHQHLHVLPGVIDIVIKAALEFNIKAIRVPNERFLFRGGYNAGLGRLIGRSGLTALALLAKQKIKKASLFAPDNFFGMLAGGNLREEYLLNILNALPAGTSEVMIHPGDDDAALKAKYGWPYNWQAELAAVTSPQVLEKIKEEKIELISFKDI